MSNYFEEINKILQEQQKKMELLLKLTNPVNNIVAIGKLTKNITNVSSKIEEVASVLSKYDIKNFQVVKPAMIEAINRVKLLDNPLISLPKVNLNLPNIKIDYERIKKITNHNSSYGWTLTGEIAINLYLDDDLLEYDQAELDRTFEGYYSMDDGKLFNDLKENILNNVDEKWEEMLKEIFDLYKSGRYIVIVPLLISIIEGELSRLISSNAYGRKLIKEWKGNITNDEKIVTIASYSLHRFFDKVLFAYVPFETERKPLINRNWIIHGRDDPDLWKKADALRLLNVLSTLLFIND
ncbi:MULTISPECIES: hypothetical protein [Heyndrickxia]|uniref:hypothetical protein n=1 Tax=Heyndrickxia TaxID=2837504 RepID=UPI00216443BA|nr:MULTISPECIES: hypothetical protein [Heyndrickxia]MED4921139.1 hypothetical protein [Weizmannia sp. CD-2023]